MATGYASFIGQRDLRLDSWEQCVGLLLSSGGEGALYRGQRCFDWDLRSSLERALIDYAEKWDEHKLGLMKSMAADGKLESWTLNVESRLLQDFKYNALRFEVPDLPADWDRLGWWELMQHHGAPTRLLDWTTSPFIALWFAVHDHQDGTGDMALWVYDRATAEANLRESRARLRGAGDYEELEERQVQNKFLEIAREDDVGVLIPVRPRQFQRAVAQQSILTVAPRIGVARIADWHFRQELAIRIRLREEWKSQMLAACRSMGLSRVSLFRDLDSLGASVNDNFVSGREILDVF